MAVVMPTYDQARFLPRAIESLFGQTLRDWELWVVDDGSPDDTGAVLDRYADSRIKRLRLDRNRGMGAAINAALDRLQAPLVAYLPSDDLYHAVHLESLARALSERPEAPLAYSGVRHHYNREAISRIEGESLQLVQVMHRRSPERWIERETLVTDDLDRMFFSQLLARGQPVTTDLVTCEWVAHPGQRHKCLREPEGGIARYRQRFHVSRPLRFHTTTGNPIDEPSLYERYRGHVPKRSPDGLKILLVGELAYNADRILALEELGHRLYGLWMPDPYWYNTVGPLPFGHVVDLPRDGWREAVRQVSPDVIYALLNWQAVPFAAEVRRACPEVPFVWHFKEGPFICLEKGTWPDLHSLYAEADGRVYSSEEMREWFEPLLPDAGSRPTLVLDGDLPKREWCAGARSVRLGESTGEIHTVVPGRPIGLHPECVARLKKQRIHLHFYGEFTHGQWREWIERASRLAEGYLHLHPHVSQDRWVAELSQYDAGWLHYFESANGGELRRANWDDLNLPARIATYALAGLPMILRDNRPSRVAAQRLLEEWGAGVLVRSLDELGDKLRDERAMALARERAWASREAFTFDAHAPRLVRFFRDVMASRSPRLSRVTALR